MLLLLLPSLFSSVGLNRQGNQTSHSFSPNNLFVYMTVVLALGVEIPSICRGKMSYKNLEMEGLSCTGILTLLCLCISICLCTQLYLCRPAQIPYFYHYLHFYSILFGACGLNFSYVNNFIYVGYRKFLISILRCSTLLLATKVQLFFLCMVLELSWSIFVTI